MLTAAVFLVLAAMVGAGFLAVLLAVAAAAVDRVELPDDDADADRYAGGAW